MSCILACEQQTHFRSSLLSLFFGGREATTGNASAVRRIVAERMGAGTGTLAMVGARTYKAVGLSQAKEGYRTEFYIHLVPANA